MKRCVLLWVVAGAAGYVFAGADMLGFWDFRDGPVGEDVSTFSNSAGSGNYVGTGYANQTVKPIYSSDAPGSQIYGDSLGSALLCKHPHSLAFNYPEGATSAAGGGYAMIADLALELSKKDAYTIEYFIKFDKNFDYYAGGGYKFYSKSSLWVGNGTTGYKVVTPNTVNTSNGHAVGFSLQSFTRASSFGTSAGSTQDNADYSDGSWHHIAVVYGDGQITFYGDKNKIGSFDLVNTDGAGLTDVDFVLGTGRSGKRTTEPFHGQISCLRVSDGALTKDEFLCAVDLPDVTPGETVGFWDFSDGTPGANITTVTNRLDPENFTGVAVATTAVVPTYSAETPARYVFSDTTRTNLLAMSPLSAYFGTGDAAGKGGKISLDTLATSLTRLDEYTVEFFYKVNVPSLNNYRTLVGWKYGDNAAVKANLTCNNTEFNACSLESLVNTSGTSLTGLQNGYLWTPMGTKWHHFAAVYTRADNAICFYIDRARSTPAAVTNQTPIAHYPLVLGNSAFSFKESQEVFGGNIACVRVTARALGTDEFMVAADKLVPLNTVFALNFEEGEAGAALPAGSGNTGEATSSYPEEIKTRINYNLHAGCKPQYARSLKKGREVLWGDDVMWANGLCLRFPAGADLPSGTANRYYYGAMLEFPGQAGKNYNPSSWTMESYVRLEKLGLTVASVKQGLIFGKAGNTAPTSSNPIWYPRSSWLLSYTDEGKLKLEWTERPTPDFEDYKSDSTHYKSVTTPGVYLNDLAWHHVALSYDAEQRRFLLYFDRKPILEQPMTGDGATLFDGPYSYYFCRFPTTGGFEGFMDEIRFTSKVLTPEAFEDFPSAGMFLMLR